MFKYFKIFIYLSDFLLFIIQQTSRQTAAEKASNQRPSIEPKKPEPLPAKPGTSGAPAKPPTTLAQKQARLINERLSEKSKALPPQIAARIKSSALNRILNCAPVTAALVPKEGEEEVAAGRQESRKEVMKLAQREVMAGLASMLSLDDVRGWTMEFLSEDPEARVELILACLFREYGQLQNFSPVSSSVLRLPNRNNFKVQLTQQLTVRTLIFFFRAMDPSPSEAQRYDVFLTGALKTLMSLDNFAEKYSYVFFYP